MCMMSRLATGDGSLPELFCTSYPNISTRLQRNLHKNILKVAWQLSKVMTLCVFLTKCQTINWYPAVQSPKIFISQGIYAAALKQFSLWPGQLHDMIQI